MEPAVDTQNESPGQAPGLGSWMKDLPALEDNPPETTIPAQLLKDNQAVQPKETSPPPAEPDPPKTEAKVEAKVEAKDDDAEDKWPRSGSDWEKFKTKRKEREQKLQAEIQSREAKLSEYDGKLKTLETELSSLREKSAQPSPEHAAQIEKLTKELEDYSQRLAAAEVTSHPKFIAHFDAKLNQQKNIIGQIVRDDALAKSVFDALTMPEGEIKSLKVEEVLSELSSWQQGQLAEVANQLRRIEMERQAEIENAKTHRATLQKNREESVKQAQNAGKKLFADTLKALQQGEDNVLWKERDGDTQWNQQVKANVAEAEAILLGKDKKPEDIARAAFSAAAFPLLLKRYQFDMKSRDEKISKLEEQVKTMLAAQPTLGKPSPTRSGEGDPSESAKPNKGMSPMEASANFMKGIQSDMQQGQ